MESITKNNRQAGIKNLNLYFLHAGRGKYLYLTFLVLLSISGYSQEPDTTSADISNFRFEDYLGAKCFLATTARGSLPDREIPKLNFQPNHISNVHLRFPPDSMMEKDNYMRIVLYNSSDTIKEFCFLPGFYCRSIELFKSSVNDPVDSFSALPFSITREGRYAGARRIKLNAKERAIIYCKF